MSDKKLDAIKAQIKTELDSMILKEFGNDSRLTGLSDSEKITTVITDFETCVKSKSNAQAFYAPETKERIIFEFEGFKVKTYRYIYNLFRLLNDNSRLCKEYRVFCNPKKRDLPAYGDSFFRMAVDFLKEEDYESLQSLNELKPGMLLVAENKNSKSEQFGRIFLAVKKAGKFYYWADLWGRGNELMNNEKIPFAEIGLDDFFESHLHSTSEKIEDFVVVCADIAKEKIQEVNVIPVIVEAKPLTIKPKKQTIKKPVAKKYIGLSNGLNLVLATKKPKKRALKTPASRC